MPRCLHAASLCACLAALSVRLAGQDVTEAPTARHWSLPLFSKEGYRTMTLSGSVVHPIDENRIDVTGANFVFYAGGAIPHVDTVLLSPSATFFLKEKIARGSEAVRMTRDDADITGVDWVFYYAYRPDQKKVSIARHTRVVFHAPLPDFLK